MVNKTPAAIASIVLASILLALSIIACIVIIVAIIAVSSSGAGAVSVVLAIAFLPYILFIVAAALGIAAGCKVISKGLWIGAAVLACISTFIILIVVIAGAAQGVTVSGIVMSVLLLLLGIGLSVATIFGAVQCDTVQTTGAPPAYKA